MNWKHVTVFCALISFVNAFDYEALYSEGYDLYDYSTDPQMVPGHQHQHQPKTVVKKQPITLPAAQSLQDFACDLINSMSADQLPGNTAVSPLSMYTALAMLRPGLGGESLSQVNAAMRTESLGEEEICEMYDKVFKPNKKLRLRYANRVYADKSIKLKKQYRSDLKSLNTTQVRRMDFSGKVEQCRQKINRYVRKKTRNLVPEILPEGAVDQSTKLVLINALYMKAPWQVKFEEENTKLRKFWLSESTAIKVPTMFHKMYFCTVHTDDVTDSDITVLTLEEGVSMLLVMPKQAGNFTRLYDNEQGSTKDKIDNIIRSIWREDSRGSRDIKTCAITLPKFNIDHSIDEPKSVLRRMGIRDIFDAQSADLSRLTNINGLYVNDVRHKTTFRVAEDGVEAAAATAMGVVLRQAVGNFRPINKPFMYFVRHDSTGALLFAGKVVNPIAT